MVNGAYFTVFLKGQVDFSAENFKSFVSLYKVDVLYTIFSRCKPILYFQITNWFLIQAIGILNILVCFWLIINRLCRNCGNEEKKTPNGYPNSPNEKRITCNNSNIKIVKIFSLNLRLWKKMRNAIFTRHIIRKE